MSLIEVIANQTTINFDPQTVEEEVIQNARTILSTVMYTVPYDRTFAIDGDYLDNPINLNRQLLAANIVQVFREREPRAIVRQVEFLSEPLDGKLIPIVRININE